MRGVSEIEDGKVNGNELTWTENVKTPMGSLTLNVTVTVDGDKISGQANTPFAPFSCYYALALFCLLGGLIRGL
jgi:hypothetical protein